MYDDDFWFFVPFIFIIVFVFVGLGFILASEDDGPVRYEKKQIISYDCAEQAVSYFTDNPDSTSILSCDGNLFENKESN